MLPQTGALAQGGQGAPVSFRPKTQFVTVPELEQLMRVCPSAEAYRLVRGWGAE